MATPTLHCSTSSESTCPPLDAVVRNTDVLLREAETKYWRKLIYTFEIHWEMVQYWLIYMIMASKKNIWFSKTKVCNVKSICRIAILFTSEHSRIRSLELKCQNITYSSILVLMNIFFQCYHQSWYQAEKYCIQEWQCLMLQYAIPPLHIQIYELQVLSLDSRQRTFLKSKDCHVTIYGQRTVIKNVNLHGQWLINVIVMH